jgi:hypothetical protein
VRWLAAFCFVFLTVPSIRSQQQEASLVDRLLRPNMELRNSDQTKKFATTNSAHVQRRGTVGTFYLQSNRTEKQFSDTRNISARGFESRQSAPEKRAAVLSQGTITPGSFSTSPARDTRSAFESHNTVASRKYSGQREYREQGKSQKSLDRQSPPMTIDQVRELLNKNK